MKCLMMCCKFSFFPHNRQGRLLPRVREEYAAFEALTLDVISKMQEEVRT